MKGFKHWIYRLDVLTDNGLLRADIKQFQSSAQPLATITGWLKSCPLGQCQFDASVPMILRWQRPRRGVCCMRPRHHAGEGEPHVLTGLPG